MLGNVFGKMNLVGRTIVRLARLGWTEFITSIP